jgi:hypothetical protein
MRVNAKSRGLSPGGDGRHCPESKAILNLEECSRHGTSRCGTGERAVEGEDRWG